MKKQHGPKHILYKEGLGVFWLRHLLQRSVRWLRKEPRSNLKICAFPDDYIGRDIAVTGTYEAAGLETIARMIDSGIIADPHSGAFLDIGANIGIYTMTFAKRFKSVIAFEPHPVTRKVLALNIDINDLGNVQISPYALSSTDSSATLYSCADNTGAASLEASENTFNSGVQVETRAAAGLVSSLCKDTPLAFIKMDVEGHEHKVLEGLMPLLREQRPVLAFESNSPAQSETLLALLKSAGYITFLALDYSPSPRSLILRVILLSIMGVHYQLRSVETLSSRPYSLVLALDHSATRRWQAS